MKHLYGGKIIIWILVALVILFVSYVFIPRLCFTAYLGWKLNDYKKELTDCVNSQVLSAANRPSNDLICSCFTEADKIVGLNNDSGSWIVVDLEKPKLNWFSRQFYDYRGDMIFEARSFRSDLMTRVREKFNIRGCYEPSCILYDFF